MDDKIADMGTKTSISRAKTAPDAPVSVFPAVARRGSQALLDCLSVVEGADSLFLLRQTGLAAGTVRSHLRGLAERGYVAPMAARPEGFRPLLRLTDEGHDAHQTVKRWRFKSAAFVLLSALSRR
jgi:DNA-binding MarR family transcriptional regulator